jgi:ribosomal protein S27AE
VRMASPCTKCGSADLIRVPAVRGPYGTGNFVVFGLISSKRVPVTRYVCGNCGYTEEWVEAQADIARLKRKFGDG